jgi:hypothetical protein
LYYAAGYLGLGLKSQIKIKIFKTYSGRWPNQGLSNNIIGRPIKSGRTVPLKFVFPSVQAEGRMDLSLTRKQPRNQRVQSSSSLFFSKKDKTKIGFRKECLLCNTSSSSYIEVYLNVRIFVAKTGTFLLHIKKVFLTF